MKQNTTDFFSPPFWQSLKEIKHSTGEHLSTVTNEKLTIEVEQLKTALKATSEGIFFKNNNNNNNTVSLKSIDFA